jgi:SAM-dependent methyltransferase
MHRKPYEFAQLVYGCRKLGLLTDAAEILSVGAGHELVLFWLANHVGRVVATDLYEGVWQDVQGREGDPGVLRRPADYAPFPYRRDHLTFLRMDGRALAFKGASFDIVYSLSSIEHFGGLAGALATVQEMARVLRPGGVAVVATEYVIAGPSHPETFQPAEIRELVDRSGLRLVEPLDEHVYRRYEYTAVDLYQNPYQTPHMVVRFNDTVFTTVMMFLRKP